MDNLKNIKDPLTQLIEIDTLRKNSPILDAAFKGAFNIKEGGGIGEMIPKLKELGIDKVIDKVAQALPAIAARLTGRAAPGMMPPSPEMMAPQVTTQGQEMPPPMRPPTPEELQALEGQHLPPDQTNPEQAGQPPESGPPPGYSNMDIVASEPPKVEAPAPTAPTETQRPPVAEGYSNLRLLPPPEPQGHPETQTQPVVQQPEQQPELQEERMVIEAPEEEHKTFTTGRKRKQQ